MVRRAMLTCWHCPLPTHNCQVFGQCTTVGPKGSVGHYRKIDQVPKTGQHSLSKASRVLFCQPPSGPSNTISRPTCLFLGGMPLRTNVLSIQSSAKWSQQSSCKGTFLLVQGKSDQRLLQSHNPYQPVIWHWSHLPASWLHPRLRKNRTSIQLKHTNRKGCKIRARAGIGISAKKACVDLFYWITRLACSIATVIMLIMLIFFASGSWWR